MFHELPHILHRGDAHDQIDTQMDPENWYTIAAVRCSVRFHAQ